MENCYYKGKAFCTFDLKDENGLYYEDIVLEWKQAAAERMLTCMECGAYVYLAAGPIKEPYFAHYDLEYCDYGNGQESEELKKGKRLLYQLLKRSFPDSMIQARYRLDNGMYSTLHCLVDNNQALAVDYRLQNNSLEKFRLRDTFYQTSNIKPLYILGIRQKKDTKQIDWFQSLLQNSLGYLAFLDSKKECLTLKKSFGYRIGKDRKFLYCIKTYPIKELKLDAEGQMICDFTEECNKIEVQIKEEKLRYQIRQQRLSELEEDRLKLEAKEQQRLEAYRKDQQIMQVGLNPALYEKCIRMIEEGNSHLVSKKYYDAIRSNQGR
ncbi:MAG: Competence protein-like protein [Herbinix sp.]|jgi:competence CoiA-like predicted nuclease|nr:Competence protein-like protein [Herbinix sp.]